MKKSTKIIAVLLTLVLLVGVIATVVSADSEATLPEGTKTWIDTSCENEQGYPVSFGVNNGFMKSIGNYSGNGFINITNYKDGAMVPHTGRQIGTLFSIYKFAADSDYVTLDFDITADKYTNGTDLIPLETYLSLSEEEQAAYSPSYTDMQFYVEVPRLYSGGTTNLLHIRKIDGAWYLCTLTTGAGGKVVPVDMYPLPEKAGVWTHITYAFVFDVNVRYTEGGAVKNASYAEYQAIADKSAHSEVTAVYSSELHIFANGEYAFQLKWGVKNVNCDYDQFILDREGSKDKNGGKIKYLQFQSTSNVYADGGSRAKTPVSINFDNVKMNAYPDGYAGDLANAIAGKSSLLNSTDTVFNVDYPFPPGTEDSASIIHQSGAIDSYFLYEKALKSLTENCILSLNKDATVEFAPEFPFYVQTNGYEFKLAYDSSYILDESGEEGIYIVRPATPADYGTVVWDDGGILQTTTTHMRGLIPHYPENTGVYVIDGTYKYVKGWSTNPNATEPETLAPVVAGSTIRLYPVFVEVTFTVVNSQGEIIAGYNDPSEIVNAINNGEEDIKIVLYKDISIDSSIVGSTKIAFTITNKSVTIDLNGNSLTRFNYVPTAGAAKELFKLGGDNTSLTIYSSVPGGEVVMATKTKTGGTGILIRSGAANANITLGNGTDNLLINAPTLLRNEASYDSTCQSALTINGGSYISEFPASANLIYVVSGRVELNATNAILGVAEGNIALFTASSAGEGAQLYGNIENCLLFGDTVLSGFKENKSTPNIFYVYDSDIIFNTDATCIGVTMYLGHGTRASKNLPNFKDMAGCTSGNITETFEISASWYGEIEFKKAGTVQTIVPESVIAPTLYTGEVTTTRATYYDYYFGKVQWQMPDGTVIQNSNNILLGNVATFDGDTTHLFGEQVTPFLAKSFSGWRNTWGNEADGSIYDLTVLGGVTNVFILECEGELVPHIAPFTNIAWNDTFVLNFYLPYDENATIDSILVNEEEVLGTLRVEKVTVDGIECLKVSTAIDPAYVEAVIHTVTYTVNGVTNTQTFSPSVETYFKTILEGEEYGKAEKELAATALNYCEAVYTYINGEAYLPYSQLLNKHLGYVKTVTNKSIRDNAKLDLSAISDSVSDVNIAVANGMNPTFAFTVKDGSTSLTFARVDAETGSTISYTAEGSKTLVTTSKISAYNMGDTFTITVGENVGTFNLAGLLQKLQNGAPTEENIALFRVYKALYAYSQAALALKNS